MSNRAPDPKAIELVSFCRQASTASGTWALAQFDRLVASFSASPDGVVAWSAEGSSVPVAGDGPEVWLHLKADTVVPLECQRCLQTFAEPLQVDRRMRFVRTEDEASRLDEELDDDVLVQPARLDLHALLEDELILALPLVPRHAECPSPLPRAAEDLDVETEPARNPFAVLASLRKPGGRDD